MAASPADASRTAASALHLLLPNAAADLFTIDQLQYVPRRGARLVLRAGRLARPGRGWSRRCTGQGGGTFHARKDLTNGFPQKAILVEQRYFDCKEFQAMGNDRFMDPPQESSSECSAAPCQNRSRGRSTAGTARQVPRCAAEASIEEWSEVGASGSVEEVDDIEFTASSRRKKMLR